MPVRFLAVGFFAIYAGVDAGSHIRREIPPHTFDSAQAKASKLATEYLKGKTDTQFFYQIKKCYTYCPLFCMSGWL